MTRWTAGERGAAAVTALLLWSVATAAGLVVVGTVTDLAVSAVRAQTAADMAALAAAGATILGPAPADPRAAALAAARLHGAELAACCGRTDVIPPAVRVTVRVTPRSALARTVRAALHGRAEASLRPAKEAAKSSGSSPVLPNN